MTEIDEDACSLNLRTFSRKLKKKLNERKAQTGKPLCRQIIEIVADHFEKEPSTQDVQRGEIQHFEWTFDMNRPLRLPTRLARRRSPLRP